MRVGIWIALIVASVIGGMALQAKRSAPQIAENSNAVLVKNEAINKENILVTKPPVSTELPDNLTAQESHTIRLFEQAAPSVCYITTTTVRRNYYSRNVEEIPSGSGSGFVWDKDGHIVTNFHVIQGADGATVTLSDGSTWQASVVGLAREKDLAVLRIDAPSRDLSPIPLGSSENLMVGQNVYAIGNPFGLDQTLTTGVVSALGREINSVNGVPIKDVIQSDAAINPGNSGGPLLNSGGRLIGVNTAIYSPSGASAGIGFSIPVDVVSWVVPDLIKYGKVNRPLIGVALTRPLRNIQGAVVEQVEENSPAEAAGIEPIQFDKYGNPSIGDIIVAVNDESINSNNDLFLALEKYQIGDEIIVTVQRNDRQLDLPIKLTSSTNY